MARIGVKASVAARGESTKTSAASLPASIEPLHIDLDAEHKALLERVTGLIADGLLWQDYLHAPYVAEMERLRDILATLLRKRQGIALLRIGTRTSDDAMRLLFLLIGCALGKIVAPKTGPEDRPLFAVTATDDPTIGGTYVGNGRNSGSLPLHTDGSGIHAGRVDILGLLCIRAAKVGGFSRFADARSVYQHLDDGVRTMLAQSFPRVDPYDPGLPADRLICRPVFDPDPDPDGRRHRFSYHPQRVRDGIRLRDGGPVALPVERALSDLDAMLEQSAAEIPLGRGDIILFDNWVVAHGRTAFVESSHSRWIERLWVEIDRSDMQGNRR